MLIYLLCVWIWFVKMCTSERCREGPSDILNGILNILDFLVTWRMMHLLDD